MARANIINIGPLLHEKREMEGKGVRETAKEIGISPATLSRVENGSTPHVEAFRRICDWLDMDMGIILGTKEKPKEETNINQTSISVHLKADKLQTPEVAQALTDMILKAQNMIVSSSQK